MEAPLVYRASSRIAKAAQRNPVWGKNKTTEKLKFTVLVLSE